MSNFGNFGKMSKKGVVSALFSFRKVGIPMTAARVTYVRVECVRTLRTCDARFIYVFVCIATCVHAHVHTRTHACA